MRLSPTPGPASHRALKTHRDGVCVWGRQGRESTGKLKYLEGPPPRPAAQDYSIGPHSLLRLYLAPGLARPLPLLFLSSS